MVAIIWLLIMTLHSSASQPAPIAVPSAAPVASGPGEAESLSFHKVDGGYFYSDHVRRVPAEQLIGKWAVIGLYQIEAERNVFDEYRETGLFNGPFTAVDFVWAKNTHDLQARLLTEIRSEGLSRAVTHPVILLGRTVDSIRLVDVVPQESDDEYLVRGLENGQYLLLKDKARPVYLLLSRSPK